MTGDDLVAQFATRVLAIVRKLGKAPMMWVPGIATKVSPEATPPGAIYDVYSNYNVSATAATKSGIKVVRSQDYYLDTLCTSDPDGTHEGTYWGYFQGWDYYKHVTHPEIGQPFLPRICARTLVGCLIPRNTTRKQGRSNPANGLSVRW